MEVRMRRVERKMVENWKRWEMERRARYCWRVNFESLKLIIGQSLV